MAIHLYYEEEYIPSDLKIVKENDKYFRDHIIFRDTPEVRRVLENLEQAEYVNEYSFVSKKWRQMGPRPIEDLSTGCKTVLNIILSEETETTCFLPIECGKLAWNEILKLNAGHSLIRVCSVIVPRNETYDIEFNGKHFSDISLFVLEVNKLDKGIQDGEDEF